MSAQPVTTGYYGKVPTIGDFVGRGLPNTFIAQWDVWLQEAIHNSRQQLGNNWLDYYLTSPIYRFVLSPGLCGNSPWTGIMMPSVDKVGRYYPMTICRKINTVTDAFSVLQAHKTWFGQIEQIARTCLEDNFDLEGFYQKICQADCNIDSDGKQLIAPETCHNPSVFPNALRRELTSIEALPDALPSLLDQLLQNHHFGYSVWCTQGSELIPSSLLVCRGLPPFDGFSAMLDGNWEKWEWKNMVNTN